MIKRLPVLPCVAYVAVVTYLFFSGIQTDALPAEVAFTAESRLWFCSLLGWLFSFLPLMYCIAGYRIRKTTSISRLIIRFGSPIIVSLLMSLYLFVQRFTPVQELQTSLVLYLLVWCALVLNCQRG